MGIPILAGMALHCGASTVLAADEATAAPSGFLNRSNGLENQAAYDLDRAAFEKTDTITGDGLGPVYNATSCAACHQNPSTGTASQIAELRAGKWTIDDMLGGVFTEHSGGSVIHQRAISAETQQHVSDDDNITALRMSTNTLGDGYIEALSDAQLKATVANQYTAKFEDITAKFGDMRGTIAYVPVPIFVQKTASKPEHFESELHIGRFGWKDQHASLTAFAADAYVNEVGITSPLQPNDNTSDGRRVDSFDPVGDPEDGGTADHPFGEDIEKFARFMRATTVPPRDFGLLNERGADVAAGEHLFTQVGCAVCHVPAWTTQAAGAESAAFPDHKVPPALGSKIVHPYSDFLLHDIGTGDGIVQISQAVFPSRATKGLRKAAKPIKAIGVKKRTVTDGSSFVVQHELS